MGHDLSKAVIRSTRAEGLDALRLLLAVWVLAAHVAGWAAANTPSWFTTATGWLMKVFQPAAETHPAVLAFIVLSGYCIHRNGLRADNLEITPYVIRRTFRILPIFVLATVIGAVAGAFVLTDPSISASGLALKLVGISAVVPSLDCAAGSAPAPRLAQPAPRLDEANPLGFHALAHRPLRHHPPPPRRRARCPRAAGGTGAAPPLRSG